MRMRSSRRNKVSKGIGSIASMVGKVSPYVAFVSQITMKDLAVLPGNRSYMQQGKDIMNIITGRMSGFHLFNKPSDYKPPFTLNPSAILSSKWVQGGLGMIAYSLIAKKVKFLPQGAKVGSIGKKIAFGGGIGALFDAPNNSTGSTPTMNYTAPMANSYSYPSSNYLTVAPSTGMN